MPGAGLVPATQVLCRRCMKAWMPWTSPGKRPEEAQTRMAVPELAIAPSTAPETTAAKIAIAGLTKTFATRGGRFTALDGISLDIPRGNFCTIVGPSGCGKTPLLRILAGLETASGGHAAIVSDNPAKPTNAMVFQGDSIFPWMTVWNNAAYGLLMRGAPKAHSREGGGDQLARPRGLRLCVLRYPPPPARDKPPPVPPPRASAPAPEALLRAEPFSALDEQNR